MPAVTPEEVLHSAVTDIPDGAVLTSAIVIVEYSLPGEDDPADVGPYLAWKRSTGGMWRHLGQLDLVKHQLLNDTPEEDD